MQQDSLTPLSGHHHINLKVNEYEGQLIVQTKAPNVNLEKGTESNGKFLIEWLKWNRVTGQKWTSSISPIYSTSMHYTSSKPGVSDEDFRLVYSAYFNWILNLFYRILHFLPRKLHLNELASIPIQIYSWLRFTICPPALLYSGYGFYFLRK